jgi:hypothetical protein
VSITQDVCVPCGGSLASVSRAPALPDGSPGAWAAADLGVAELGRSHLQTSCGAHRVVCATTCLPFRFPLTKQSINLWFCVDSPSANKRQIAPAFLPPGSYELEIYEMDTQATPLSVGQEYTLVAEWYEETFTHTALSHAACYGSYLHNRASDSSTYANVTSLRIGLVLAVASLVLYMTVGAAVLLWRPSASRDGNLVTLLCPGNSNPTD